MPERWPTRLRAVRSAVSTEASGPSISAMTWPGLTSTPSARQKTHHHIGIDRRERLDGAEPPGQHAVLPGHEDGPRPGSLRGPGWRSGRRGHRDLRPAPGPRRREPPSGADPASSRRSLEEEPVAVPGLGEREVGPVVGPPALPAGGGRRRPGPGRTRAGWPARTRPTSCAAGLLGDPPEGGVGLGEGGPRCAAPRRLPSWPAWSSSRKLGQVRRSARRSGVGNDRATGAALGP